MNITELSGVGSDSYPLVDAQLRKIIWRDPNGTKAKFGINDMAHIEMDANGDDGKEIGFYFGDDKAARMIANNLILIGDSSGGGCYFQDNLVDSPHDIVEVRDESGQSRNFIGHEVLTNQRGISIGTRRSDRKNSLSLMISYVDGTSQVKVSEPTIWRNALGIGNIGEVILKDWTKNVPNNTVTNMGNITFGPGNWWVQCIAHFPHLSSYPNGYRNIYISTTTTGSHEDRFAGSTRIARNEGTTVNTFTTLRRYGTESTQYFNVKHNAGAQINNVRVGVIAVRLTNFV